MKKTILTIAAAALMSAPAVAQQVRLAGPFNVAHPLMIDSIDAQQKKFAESESALEAVTHDMARRAPIVSLSAIRFEKGQVGVAEMTFNATRITEINLETPGMASTKTLLDGEEASLPKKVKPGAHTISLRFVADSTAAAINIKADEGAIAFAKPGEKRAFSMADNIQRKSIYDVSASANGKWATYDVTFYDENNEKQYESYLVDMMTGKQTRLDDWQWMPKSDRLFATEKQGKTIVLKTMDPATRTETVIAQGLPKGHVTMGTTEDFLIISQEVEGPKKEKGVYEIIHPDDRQPNWRKRHRLIRYDIATGLSQPLLHTWHNTYLQDVSPIGDKVIVSVHRDSLTTRPTTMTDLYVVDTKTMEAKRIVTGDGFVNSAMFAENDDKVIIIGSPECLGGIGNRVPEGMTPNMYDLQMYTIEVSTGKTTALTADFAPSVQNVCATRTDGSIYFTAENKDSVSLYKMDGKTLRISQIAVPMENVTNISVSRNASRLIMAGNSMSETDKVMALDIRRNKLTTLAMPDSERFADIALAECKEWRCTTSRGYDVTGFYSLPVGTKAGDKLPLIVHYYGGCSPSSRRFGGGSHYPVHYWNAMGFAVLTINPSGAAGFGQEWAARHVNTMGEGVAEDIIEATEQFARATPEIDPQRIGCVSASYGGFMTQLLLTKTDLFACGISHAGISSHTSYWGEGYWGYSYSEVCAAGSYPWTRKDLFVDRSPLYNVDKIHKPLLFTHGTADTNVPIGESIQMYTALRLLGVPTAFVQVEGENHGIMNPEKRVAWIESMTAWFCKWLKDDPSWWQMMYPDKNL